MCIRDSLLAVNTGLGGFSGPIGGIASIAYTERSATANANGTLNVRSGPGTTYSVVAKLSQGAAVTVIGEASASDGALWYQIRFTGSGGAPVSYTHLDVYKRQGCRCDHRWCVLRNRHFPHR